MYNEHSLQRSTTMSNNTKHNFQIRMDKELFEKVKALAKQEHRSIAAQIQSMLTKGLDNDKGEHKWQMVLSLLKRLGALDAPVERN